MSEGDGLVIGVDVGGTKVAAGFVDAAGRITTQLRKPMVADGDAAQGFAAVKAAIDALLALDSNQPVHGIGICSPGPLDPGTGVVINPPNLPCWRNFPLASETGRTYGLPVKLDNDANAAGLAEALWGAGAGYRNEFYATIGTGIGTGLVFDGALYHGRIGAAGARARRDHHGWRSGVHAETVLPGDSAEDFRGLRELAGARDSAACRLLRRRFRHRRWRGPMLPHCSCLLFIEILIPRLSQSDSLPAKLLKLGGSSIGRRKESTTIAQNAL